MKCRKDKNELSNVISTVVVDHMPLLHHFLHDTVFQPIILKIWSVSSMQGTFFKYF